MRISDWSSDVCSSDLLDVFVDRTVLVDEGVGARDVGLRLVVVVVRDEILDRIVREKLLELAVQLRRQGLVRRHDQRRPLQLLDDRSEEHTSELQSLMRISYAAFCWKKKIQYTSQTVIHIQH